MTLQCAVVGAGIAGLGAGIALRRAGHHVTIYEKSTFKNEIGAAITMTPNANLVLEAWGLDAKKARASDKKSTRRLDAYTLEELALVDISGVSQRFGGHAYNAYHRVDLHVQLREMATDPDLQGAKGPPVEIVLGKEATDVHCEDGVLIFRDGSQVEKDLIVIADGLKSNFISQVVGYDVPLKKFDKSVFRTLIPMSRLNDDPVTEVLYNSRPPGHVAAFAHKEGSLVVTYPCRDDELMNFALFHTTRPHLRDSDDWNSPATKQDVLDQLRNVHPVWTAIAEKTDEEAVKCFNLGVRAELPKYCNGKVILIGDAAHPMQPTHGQGGCVAIEDAGALEPLFAPGNFDIGRDSVAKRLELWNALRHPRDAVVQLLSNFGFEFKDPAESTAALRKYYSGPLPPLRVEGWSEPLQEFFYEHDIFREAEKALKVKDDQIVNGKLPESVINYFGVPSQQREG